MNGESAARRRTALRQYLSERLRGDRAALIRRSGLTKGRIAQLLGDDGPFGERAARDLAVRLGLPPDYFDRAANERIAPAVDRADADLLRKWRMLIPEQRDEVMQSIDVMVRLNEKAHAQLAAMHLDRAVPDDEVAKHLPPRPAQRELLGPQSGKPKRKKP